MGRFARILQQNSQTQNEQSAAQPSSSPWGKLLAAANALYRGQDVAGALHSVRRLGAECIVQADGSFRLIPGQLSPSDWEEVKKNLLIPYVPQLKLIYHFAQHGWVYLKSSILDEVIVIALDKKAPTLPPGYEVYSIEDMKVLERATPEEIRQLHRARKVFGGGNILDGMGI